MGIEFENFDTYRPDIIELRLRMLDVENRLTTLYQQTLLDSQAMQALAERVRLLEEKSAIW